MISSIVSPDKLSISMFVRFIRKPSDIICCLNYYMTAEELSSKIDVFTAEAKGNLIITHHVRRIKDIVPMDVVPEKLKVTCPLITWLDLYSVDLVVLKDDLNQKIDLLPRWQSFIEAMSGSIY